MAALNKCISRKHRAICSSEGPKILGFGSNSLENFQPILDCFIIRPNFKLKYENSENIKADHLNTVIFNLRQTKCRAFYFSDTRYIIISI